MASEITYEPTHSNLNSLGDHTDSSSSDSDSEYDSTTINVPSNNTTCNFHPAYQKKEIC